VRLTWRATPTQWLATDMDHILRVSSYNVRDLKDDVDAAARVVRAIDPDVLCLQEVPRRLGAGHRIVAFAARCGLRWAGGHRGSGGTTLMSSPRVEVESVWHRPLKVPLLQRQRGYAVSRLRLPGHQSLRVASVHLSLDAVERAAHAASILSGLPADLGLLVAGDLNEGSEGQAWSAFADGLRAVSADAPTYPAANPRQRLDVIFATPGLSAAPGGQVELDPADLVAATDHRPVWIDLDLRPLALP